MDGLLVIDKPTGLTSRQVVDRVARFVRPSKVGHAGTLDPLATGVLVVCVGYATRLISFVQEQRKTYRGVFQFGQTSDTDDITGEVTISENPHHPTDAEVEDALAEFRGEIEQVPPQFSAVHVAGQRAYRLARAGQEVTLAPRTVTVSRLAVLEFDYPRLALEIECSSGTYIRSIGRDLGCRLGCGALMSELTRTGIGPFRLESAAALDSLTRESLRELVLPPVAAVAHLPQVVCPPERLPDLACGRSIPVPDESGFKSAPVVAIRSAEGELIAMAAPIEDGGRLAPSHVFHGCWASGEAM